MEKKNQSKLVEDNSLVLTTSGVWSHEKNATFSYTDGDAAEKSLRTILAQSDDKSSLSLELESSSYDWISEYHLSSDRANIYRFLDLSSLNTGLELGAGCGAITRFLGESDIELDSIEGSGKRAQICQMRCDDLKNVNIIHSNFNELKLPTHYYDAVFLNGVLEYAARFLDGVVDDREALASILQSSLQTISDDGVICIAIENRMGLKYWMGAREDHFGIPYTGLYGYQQDEGICTYDLDEWKAILAELGVNYCFAYPFPDYKMAKSVLSERFVKENQHVYSHLYRLGSTDNGNALQTSQNEYLLWKTLHSKNKLEDFANSFFIVISKDANRLEEICPFDFMHFTGKGRRPEYRTVTSKKNGSSAVEKSYLHKDVVHEDSLLSHNLATDEYGLGKLLVTKWLQALLQSTEEPFENCLKEYHAFVAHYLAEKNDKSDIFDILPFNIIVGDNGEWTPIDREWRVNLPLTADYLLFRALFWFPEANESLLESILEQYNLHTTQDFVTHYFTKLGLNLEDNLDTFIGWEEQLQSKIGKQLRENPIRNKLLQPLKKVSDTGLALSYMSQLYWADDTRQWSEDKSVFEPGRIGEDQQTITFSLPKLTEKVTSFRFDPADRPGFFRISHLKISPAGQTEQTGNWSLHGNEQIAESAEMQGVEYCRAGLGELFVSTGNDPHFILDLPEKVKDWVAHGTVQLSVTMDWPKSADFLVVMDSLGKKVVEQQGELTRLYQVEQQSEKQVARISEQAAKLKETSDQVRAKDIYIENIEREIEAMRQTKVWRLAEFLRLKIYYRLLDMRTLAQKSVKTLRQEGVKQFIRKSRQHLSKKPDSASVGLNRSDYELWVEHNSLTEYDKEEMRNAIDEFDWKPLFSIVVPVYDVDQVWLERTIDSVRSQIYDNWELCLCDDLSPSPHIKQVLRKYEEMDKRIKVLFKETNEGIAITSNRALSMATGDYVALLDHDDEITIDALYENARVINEMPGVGLIYSDEDKLDMQGRRCDPFFKPDYSPELIRSQNYICHFTVIKKSILDELGGFRMGYDGSQDHDLILRVLEKSDKVHHIPKILYHWRKIPGSTAAVYDSKSYAWEAGRKAVEDSLAREGIKGETVFARFQGSYKVDYGIEGNPLVSIIIPFKDKPELLETAVNSILEKTTYPHFEILGVNNNSLEKTTLQLMEKLSTKDKRVRFIDYDKPFNFSAINNHAAEIAKGDYLLLLNNDVELISPSWLEALLGLASQPEIGAVGGRLYYQDDRIQHAGIVIGMAGVAGPPHHLFHRDDVGYYARSHVIHNVSAVTGACLMVEKRLWNLVEGMDEENFGVAYNDVDFCLKLLHKGYRNVFTPYCELYHFESLSRGYEDTPEKMERLNKESAAFTQKWSDFIEKGDPYHNPHLSITTTNYSVRIGDK